MQGFPGQQPSNNCEVIKTVLLVAMCSEPSEIRQRYYIVICSPSSAFYWVDPKAHDTEWPWVAFLCYILFFCTSVSALLIVAFGDSSTKANKDIHALSAAKMFNRNSSLWWYKVYADIPGVLWKGSIKWLWVVGIGDFSVLLVDISLESLEIMPQLCYGNI